MQLMTWTIARLGSRFNLLFEPYHKRVMHSGMGRFLDQPLDLMVGLIEPDGTRRVLPFTQHGQELFNTEQFERFNSCTWRGFSEKYNLRFEFNVHSPFYPQAERLSIAPVFYLEMRVHRVPKVRWNPPKGPTPDKVTLFLRVGRPDTQIEATARGDDSSGTPRPRIKLGYKASLEPHTEYHHPDNSPDKPEPRTVQVYEQIVSLNPECTSLRDGDGLECELPVTEVGRGTKWRLVWGAHVADPVLTVKDGDREAPAVFKYADEWDNVEDLIDEAIQTRDERLALSRRFERLLDQVPLDTAQRHLIHQSFQAYTSNTFWCTIPPETREVREGAVRPEHLGEQPEWFSVWEGSCFFHSTIDVEYNVSLLYLTLWPKLLAMQLRQWTGHENPHEPSGGTFLSHDMGSADRAVKQHYPHHMEAEENCNFLLLLQAYTRWTGDKSIAKEHPDVVARLTRYLLWTDRDASGFPSEGVANTIDDASPATQFSRKQTYLAVKRCAALRAAADVLAIAGAHPDLSHQAGDAAEADIAKVDQAAWLGDHYATSVDKSAVGILDPWTGKPLPFDELPGWDAYSIYTGNGLLLPLMVGQPSLLPEGRLKQDITNAARENLSRYGCGHTSSEIENIWVSQNLWRDILARYLQMHGPTLAQHYWDMQVMSNTQHQSLGFIDTYINNYLCFYPRGITSIGYLLAGPRLVIDRLAPNKQGVYITVDPDRYTPARWPLLPLADWKAGKIPVCVVDYHGEVTIECMTDPVVVQGNTAREIRDKTSRPAAGLIG